MSRQLGFGIMLTLPTAWCVGMRLLSDTVAPIAIWLVGIVSIFLVTGVKSYLGRPKRNRNEPAPTLPPESESVPTAIEFFPEATAALVPALAAIVLPGEEKPQEDSQEVRGTQLLRGRLGTQEFAIFDAELVFEDRQTAHTFFLFPNAGHDFPPVRLLPLTKPAMDPPPGGMDAIISTKLLVSAADKEAVERFNSTYRIVAEKPIKPEQMCELFPLAVVRYLADRPGRRIQFFEGHALICRPGEVVTAEARPARLLDEWSLLRMLLDERPQGIVPLMCPEYEYREGLPTSVFRWVTLVFILAILCSCLGGISGFVLQLFGMWRPETGWLYGWYLGPSFFLMLVGLIIGLVGSGEDRSSDRRSKGDE